MSESQQSHAELPEARISTQAQLGAILECLGEPTRRRIVSILGSEQLSVTEIVELLDISQPTASKHLKKLREAGVIVMRPDAQRRLYRVSRDAFTLLAAWSAELASGAKPVGSLHEDLTVRARKVAVDIPSEKDDPSTGVSAAAERAGEAAAAFLQNIPTLHNLQMPKLSRLARRRQGK